MTRIGITGGIGSGKSGIAEILRVKGIPVYDADSASKKLISTQPELIQNLKNLLGEDIYDSAGCLNRKRMAELIFNNPDLLEKTNNIIHPAVGKDFMEWSRRQPNDIVAIESALLFQSKMDISLDSILVVNAPQQTRIRRVILRDNTTYDKVMARMDKQMSSDEMCAKAHYVIRNDDNDAVLPQINKILSRLGH